MKETHSKENVTSLPEAEFSLTETILWEHCCGYWLLPEHLARLKASAAHFSWQYDETELAQQLDTIVEGLDPHTHKVHLLLNQNGEVSLSVESADETRAPVRARLSKQCIDVDNVFLYHNTTHRKIYDEAYTDVSGVDEVLLWNSKGEVTESCTANIVVETEEQYYTPPVSCGLLPGTYRANLLQEGSLKERPISIDQLQDDSKIFLINSLVGWREVKFTP